MSTHGPFHRLGSPGGAGCPVTTLPVEARDINGTPIRTALQAAESEASELELLRTVAWGLGVQWGHDPFGWWAAVPMAPRCSFAAKDEAENATQHALYREDDNGVRFLIATFNSRKEAEERATDLAKGGHKQTYFVESATSETAS